MSRASSQADLKCLKEQGKETGSGFDCGQGVRPEWEVPPEDVSLHGLNLLPAPKEKHPGFLISLSKCGTQRKERMGLKSYLQSNTQKTEPDSLLQIQCDKKCCPGGLQEVLT